MKNDLMLYIHIPYCLRKCAYCDFYSLPDISSGSEYCRALIRQLACFCTMSRGRTITSVYIGGGTPTVLPFGELASVISYVNENFRVAPDAEITVEANPATVSDEQLRCFHSLGVNRISFGCQSANDNELVTLGRAHNFADFCDSYRLARNAGFENISADLMYGIPDQTCESLRRSIDAVASLGPEHISLYGLKIEPMTRFGKNRESYAFPDDDSFCEMYLLACDRLEKYGYGRYEISNFARAGRESRHNLGYWLGSEYFGAGTAAASYFGNVRFCASRDLSAYTGETDFTPRNGGIYCEYAAIDERGCQEEHIMLGLRLSGGVEFSEDEFSRLSLMLRGLSSRGYARLDGRRVSLTPEGSLVSNSIISDILVALGF